jgi:hypothetical protein
LYEEVWKTPISRLAAEYGISDVALAKTCKRFDIPRPGRGHWARLAAGEKIKRPPLPKGVPNRLQTIMLTKVENPTPKVARPKPPDVPVARALSGAHPAVQAVGASLAEAKTDTFGRMVIEGPDNPVVAVTLEVHRRALLILDAVCKAVVARGHAVIHEVTGKAPTKLAFVVSGEEMGVAIVEQLDRKDHVPTSEEQQRIARGFTYGIPKYDQFAGGKLQLVLVGTRIPRSSWSDGRKRRLEQWLGHVVIAAEDEVEARRNYREAQERQRQENERRRRAEDKERERAREQKARADHRALLIKDLQEMSRNWHAAREIREFLDAVGRAIPEGKRDKDLVAWLEWAGAITRELDPIARPETIAKILTPVLPGWSSSTPRASG